MLLPARALAAWPQALFSAPTSRDAIDALQAGAAEPGRRILLEVPEIADRGDLVPIRVMSTLPATEQITLLVDKALRPVVAQFNLTTDAEPDVSLTIKLPGTSTVRAVVKAGGKLYVVSKEVKLAAEPYVPADQGGKTKKGSGA
ncbi:thiosulfate oxidation carrier protein SoxY [Chitinimonas naiadis]